MITKTDTALTKVLLDKKLVDPVALEPIAAEAVKSKDSLYAILSKRAIVGEDMLLKSLAEAMQVPLLTDAELKAEPGVTEKIPLKIAEYYKFAPIKIVKRKLTIAISQPLDLRTQDDIRAHLGFEIETVLARERDITEAVKRFYGFAAGTIGDIVASGPEMPAGAVSEPLEKLENLEKMVGDASIVKLVNQIILEAYRKRATDIHIEPYRGKVKLRYRIDGVLYNANVPAEMARLILPILSRIKIMSNLNIVEKRLPQDGRAIVKVEDTQLDLRVSSIPTPYGESVVIRMLPMNRVFKLEQLGLDADQLKIFIDLVNKPHGVIFITGPTGSGKSTTLYACLNKINTDERKIITIEDPVEYEMEGVTQIQVQQNIGLDFAKGLRSMLRHDPDVMMVGEVRDQETAESAIRSALTGHLVFSTLHTNDSASGITRLVDIGVAPYLVASSVEAFVAQRLVRVICQHCKEEDKSPGIEDIKKMIGHEMRMAPAEAQKIKILRGRGCNQCNQTGFWGRVAVYEILLSNEPIKRLIMKRSSASEIKQTAVYQGMRTLRQDGWRKVIAGVTTPDEIIEIAQEAGERGAEDAVDESPLSPLFDEKKLGLEAAEKSEPRRGAEKRAFGRVDDTFNVRYRIVKYPPGSKEEPDGAEQFTATRNVSAGGLVFISKDPIPLGSILELKPEIPDGAPPMACLAKIVRVQEAEGGLFEKAVCFLDLSRTDRARIEKFIVGVKK
jgi:type II secretory ATPase GspE/PulE/Tfp pilus assembly ATPase PilB-like protein